ncbi:MAG: branched-chain amino acid transport system ATP-binding protein [Acidimicrobiia bacterium]|jgi:branched-chain amino acid transport system ATP-binding protein|nr:branched-chain amino acid transport system ATP-binding protein [Acidimicrobiia bacterium]
MNMVTPKLKVTNVDARYGQVQVLRGISFEVKEGEVVVVLGANGAGKTTSLRAICGMVSTTGSVQIEGQEVRGRDTADIVRRGVAHVPQGRGTFPELSVLDNLHVGAYVRKDRKGIEEDVDRWLEVFPRLSERRSQSAGSLSGGEQQMLAVARAMMSRPKLLLLDEPSLGLAPLIIEDLFRRFGEINKETGTTMLIVEQNANLALDIADRGYVLESGSMVLSGTADELRTNEAVREAYLGA